METQGWQLRRCLSFTQNRLVNRPHRPLDPMLRTYLSKLGFEWPEADVKQEQAGEDVVEEGGGEEDGEMLEGEGVEAEEEEHPEEDPEVPVAEVTEDLKSLSLGEGQLQEPGAKGGEQKDAACGSGTSMEVQPASVCPAQQPQEANLPASPKNEQPSSTLTPPPCYKSPPSLTPEAVSVTCL